MCDGKIEKADPEGLIGYVAVPVSKWRVGYSLCLKYHAFLPVGRTFEKLDAV